jgi:hypothetical protein
MLKTLALTLDSPVDVQAGPRFISVVHYRLCGNSQMPLPTLVWIGKLVVVDVKLVQVRELLACGEFALWLG